MLRRVPLLLQLVATLWVSSTNITTVAVRWCLISVHPCRVEVEGLGRGIRMVTSLFGPSTSPEVMIALVITANTVLELAKGRSLDSHHVIVNIH